MIVYTMRLTDMNKLCIPLVLVLLAMVFVSGCTTPETFQEASWRRDQSWLLDSRMTMDDFEYVMLINRNSSLSQFHQRMGY